MRVQLLDGLRIGTIVVLGVILGGCAVGFREIPMELSEGSKSQANGIYEDWREKGFCVGSGGIYNIQVGGWMTSPVPVCEPGDVVFHTHPWWAEGVPNVLDAGVWIEYDERYNGRLFGLMTGVGEFRVYERKD